MREDFIFIMARCCEIALMDPGIQLSLNPRNRKPSEDESVHLLVLINLNPDDKCDMSYFSNGWLTS